MTGTAQTENKVVLGIADLRTGQAPLILETNLGSCIAVCLYCFHKKAGGMLHIMMPAIAAAPAQTTQKLTKYADSGVPELIRELTRTYNVGIRDLTAKVFGGAKILKDVSINMGELNDNAVRRALEAAGIPVTASKTGGTKGYRISFNLDSGAVCCQNFGENAEDY